MLKLRVVSAFALFVAVVGCNSVESGDVETAEMTASIAVTAAADGTGADVFASLANAALTFVDLDGEDKLTAAADDVTVDLAESNLLGVFAYRAGLDDVVAGDEVTVSLVRAEGKDSALSNVVVVPTPLTIESPAAAASFSRANDDIVIDLGGPDDVDADALEVRWSGDCIDTGSLEVPVTQKSITIARGTIEQLPQPEAGSDGTAVADECALTVTVARRITGTIDGAWRGSITGVATDDRIFTTAL